MIRKYIAPLIFITLTACSLVPLVSFTVPGLPLTHDGTDHVARIANFYASLAEGNIVPRWASNLNWGYGHPILMFLYPLPSYMASFFHLVGFGLVDATKLVFVLSFVLSVLCMYLWVGSVWGKKAGFISALLYGFAPYRFVDMYVRGAIGEHVAFIFPPLICFFIHKQALGQKGRWYPGLLWLSLSIAGLILSHNAISILFFPTFLIYALFEFYTTAHQKLLFLWKIALSFLLGFGISSFFWIPAFFEGKYTLRDIVTKGSMADRFVPFSWFFRSPWNYGGGNEITKEIGIVQWMGVAIACLPFLYEKGKRIILAIFVGIFLVSLFLMTSYSALIWEKITLLEKFQFPWRILSLSVFSVSLVGGISFGSLFARAPNLRLSYRAGAIAMIFLLLCALSYSMWRPKGFTKKDESYYSGVYEGTTDTGESSPIWSVRFMEHTPSAPLEIASGQVLIRPIARTTTQRQYEIDVREPSRLVENTLFFPGWKIFVDSYQAGIQFQDPEYRGLMTFRVEEGKHIVKVLFTDTKLRRYANYISLVSIAFLAVLAIPVFILCKKRK